MTKEELNSRIAEIEKEAEEKKRAARIEYVRKNAKFKRGDIVSDACCTIRVDEVRCCVFGSSLSISYYGPVLTKNLIPRKDGSKTSVYEENIKEK